MRYLTTTIIAVPLLSLPAGALAIPPESSAGYPGYVDETIISINEVGDDPPPVADAGPDQVVEQDSAAGAKVALDGSGSTGGGVQGTWSHVLTRVSRGCSSGLIAWAHDPYALPYPIASASLTINAYDVRPDYQCDVDIVDAEGGLHPLGELTRGDAVWEETVSTFDVDPAWLGPNEIAVTTGPDQCIAVQRSTLTVAFGGLAYEWYEGPSLVGTGETLDVDLPLGEHTLTLVVTDAAGNSDSDEVIVTVQDTTPPEMSLNILQDMLWPANHRLYLCATVTGVADICDADPEVEIEVACDECGDGGADWAVVENGDTWEIWLRAERGGPSTGRVYTIEATVTDDSGNATTDEGIVTVPHDQGNAGGRK